MVTIDQQINHGWVVKYVGQFPDAIVYFVFIIQSEQFILGNPIVDSVILQQMRLDWRKKRYYENVNKKLSDPAINIKSWWSLSKRLCGSMNVSRIPTIVENDVLITDPKEKACIFNDYFVAQSQLPGTSDSTIPPVYLSIRMPYFFPMSR